MSLPTRGEVPEAERWDPSLVYDSREDWQAATEQFEARLDDLRAFEGRATEDGETLLDVLDLTEELNVRRLGSIHLYPYLLGYVDTTDEDAREMRGRYRSLRADLESVLGRIETELARADRERIDDLVAATPGLARHEAHLDRLLHDADHVLGPETESALADLGPAFETGTRVGRAIGTDDLVPPTFDLPDGESVTVTKQRRSKLLQHPDRDVRKTAYDRYLDALADHRHRSRRRSTSPTKRRSRQAFGSSSDGWARYSTVGEFEREVSLGQSSPGPGPRGPPVPAGPGGRSPAPMVT